MEKNIGLEGIRPETVELSDLKSVPLPLWDHVVCLRLHTSSILFFPFCRLAFDAST